MFFTKKQIDIMKRLVLLLLLMGSMAACADIAAYRRKLHPQCLQRIGYEYRVPGLHTPESINAVLMRCALPLGGAALVSIVLVICLARRRRWKGFFLASGMIVGMFVLLECFCFYRWKKDLFQCVLRWGEKSAKVEPSSWREVCGRCIDMYLLGEAWPKYEREMSEREQRSLHERVAALAPELQQAFDAMYKQLQSDGLIDRCDSIAKYDDGRKRGLGAYGYYEDYCRRVRESNKNFVLMIMLLRNLDLSRRCIGIPFEYLMSDLECPDPEGVSSQQEIRDFRDERGATRTWKSKNSDARVVE